MKCESVVGQLQNTPRTLLNTVGDAFDLSRATLGAFSDYQLPSCSTEINKRFRRDSILKNITNAFPLPNTLNEYAATKYTRFQSPNIVVSEIYKLQVE